MAFTNGEDAPIDFDTILFETLSSLGPSTYVTYEGDSKSIFIESNESTLPAYFITEIQNKFRSLGIPEYLITETAIRSYFLAGEYYNVSGNIFIRTDNPDIVSGYYIDTLDPIDNEHKYTSEEFPYSSNKYYSGYSLILSGEVTYDDSGYMLSGTDIASKPSEYWIDNKKDLLSGKYDKYNVSSFRNSGIIYGKHLPDDIDMNIRVKRKEHIKNSLHLVYNSDSPYVVNNVTKNEVLELGNNMEIRYIYEGAIITINETEKLKNSSYSIYKEDRSGLPYGAGIKLTYLGTVDTNRFVVEAMTEETDFYITIVPGIYSTLSMTEEEAKDIFKIFCRRDTSNPTHIYDIWESTEDQMRIPKITVG
jgi:hypothetical protein